MEHISALIPEPSTMDAGPSSLPAPDSRPAARRRLAVIRQSAPTDWTAGTLLSTTFLEPPWLVPGLLPVGLATLGGKPKSGKSWLALQLAVAVAGTGRFLDLPIAQGKVLYIALEDSPRRLQHRLRALHASPGLPLAFALADCPLADRDGLKALQTRIVVEVLDLVIIDTLARATSQLDGGDVAPTTAVLGLLQHMASVTGCTILTIDHHRKQPGFDADPVGDIIGGTGKGAVFDTVLGLYRKQGTPDAFLRAAGRDMDDAEVAITFHSATAWTRKIGANDVAQSEAEEQALGAVRSLGEADAGNIAAELGKSRQALIPVLRRLASRGVLRTRCTHTAAGSAKLLYSLNTPGESPPDSGYSGYSAAPGCIPDEL